MFSLAEHYPVSENQFSAGSILHPCDHFFFYYGYILSEFHVCCGNEKKKNRNVHILHSVPFWFLTCTSWLSSPWGVLPTVACRTVSLGFLGFLGARTSINLKGAQCLVEGESRLISISDSLFFCESKPVWNHSTCPDGLFCTSSSSSSQRKLRLHPSNPG